MSDPLFTVLMPTHNRADVIGFAIESVLRQTLGDFELIIVGDGCTDDTAEVAARFRDPRVIWLDYPKAPFFGYANRNAAMTHARGRYVAYCAHDDILFDDHLYWMAFSLKRGLTPLVYSQSLWVSSDGVMAPIPGDLRNPSVAERFQRQNFIPLSNFAHTRALYDEIGGWPEDATNAADWLMWKAMIARIGPSGIEYLRRPTLLHFVAIWKDHRDSGLPEFAAALSVADATPSWPPALRLNVDAAATLQAVVALAMAERPMRFVMDVRDACAAVLDQLALDTLRDLLPGLQDLLPRAETEASPNEVKARAPLARRLVFDLMLRLSELEAGARAAAAARGALGVEPCEMGADDETTLIRRSGLLDEAWYLDTYPDVRAANIDPVRHFCASGWREARKPNRYFDTALYLEQRPELLAMSVNPLVDYLRRRS